MNIEDVLTKIKDNKKNYEFIPSGFPGLDKRLDGGFLKKELIVLGGHTGIGKSFVAGQLLYNIAEHGFICSYYSLEISNEMLVSRMIGAKSNIKPTRIMAGLLTKEEYEEKLEVEAEISGLKDFMFFHDDLYTLEEIKNNAKEEKPEFIVIDFIQNVFGGGSDEYERLSKIALELQRFAKELNACILVLSQLSNRAAREGASAPIVEYRGSGNIAQVCDLGFFLEVEKGDNKTDKVKIYLRKNRRGMSGWFSELTFRQPGGLIYETSNQSAY